jgi:hypothetical protein
VWATHDVHPAKTSSLRTTPRFPPPWSVEELEACFVVRDDAGQKLAFIHFEEEPGRRSAAKLLTKDDRRAFASKRGKKHSPAMLLAHFVGDARSREPLIRTGLIEALDY